MDKVIVTVSGISLIVFIYWFFFRKKDIPAYAETSEQGNIYVVVNGGYKPSVIKIKKGKTITINIKRSDPNSCLEEIILSDFGIKKYLPLNKEVQIEITPQKKGEFPFHCGMNMYHGKIIVE